jgi:very-short-patch-repair endonuclease
VNTKYTTEEIVKQFKAKHGKKFDYSKVEYVNAKTKVTITCKEHGDFEQSPESHRRGSGCPICKGRGQTTKSIIKEFNKVHGGKYDYSRVDYKGSITPVSIICKEHGEFMQTPSVHKQGSGCSECSSADLSNRYSTNIEKVLKAFKKAHGTKYDYSLVEYVNARKNVKIICPTHGVFEQLPMNHNRGMGCRKCSAEKRALEGTSTREEVIEQFKEIHGDKFSYENLTYKNHNTKVEIICNKHGSFFMLPGNHKNGMGCPTCGGTEKYTTETIIQAFKKEHGDLFDYSLVKYKDSRSKIIIICGEHGKFKQTPSGHLSGKLGCKKCLSTLLSETLRLDNETLILQFQKVHANRYDYSLVNNKSNSENVKIICSIHGVFEQSPSNHKRGQDCPLCTLTPQSKQELMINFELQQFFPKINPRGYKTRISGKLWSIDIYLPSINLGIEFDGRYWHKEKADLDKVKTLQLRGEGFNIIRVRQKPLKRIFDTDIMSDNPFNANQVVNNILAQIMNTYDLDKDVKSKIKHYISLKKLKNQDALNEYIEEIMEEKESRKN